MSLLNSEFHGSNFVPYAHHLTGDSVIFHNDWLMKVIKVEGFSFETADDEDVDIHKSIINQMLRNVSSGSLGLYFHVIRRRKNAFSDDFAQANFANYFANQVNLQWRDKHAKKLLFVNELYISVIRKVDAKGVNALKYLYDKIIASASKANWEQSIRDTLEELDEVTNRILTGLRQYSARLLSTYKIQNSCYSEILEFLTKIINCGMNTRVLMPVNRPISEMIPLNRLYFGSRFIEISNPNQEKKYAGIVSIKEYGQQTFAGMLDAFLQLPYELVISQSFSFTNRQIAIGKMQLQQNRMIQSQDKAISQIAEITQALDDAMSGKIAFGEHHLSILCAENNLKNLEGALSLVESELSSHGVYSVRERMNLEPAFWAQLPGNFNFIVRKAVISTINLAGFSSLHNYPVGNKFNNHWGEAVTIFDTTSGTPYFFNFHARDVGHTTIIGPTGAGKTVLMNFLCAQAMKYSPRLFFFDKDQGAEIFIRALGGVYTIIEPRTPTGFNPLQMEDTPDNRTFLMEWIRSMASVIDSSFNSDDMARINEAIEGNFKLKKEDRVLRNLVPFLGLEGAETLAGRISMWHGRGSHAALFDNPEDKIDFSKSHVFGFEMGQLLKDKAALGPTLSYIFHRINISLDGSPTMIILDEAWALIDNPVFAPKIKDWLKVLRKLNAMVVFATQSVEDASKSSISDTLIQQTATQIFLPNLKATSVYRDVFMLSEREYTLIKHTDPGSRFFLIKQGPDAVVARTDLSGMNDIINVLSGRAETIIMLKEIMAELGTTDPTEWLPVFYQRLRDAKKS